MKNLDTITKDIMSELGFTCVNFLPYNSIRAIDNHAISSYQIDLIKPELDIEVLRDLYYRLVLGWVFHTPALTNSDWGEDESLRGVYLIDQPFTNKLQKMNYKYKGMSASPINMISIAEDMTYYKTCLDVYRRMYESYSKVLALPITSSAAGLSDCARAIEMYIESFTDLQTIFEDIVPRIDTYQVPVGIVDVSKYLFSKECA